MQRGVGFYLMGREFLFEMMVLGKDSADSCKHCKWILCPWTVYLKMIIIGNFVLCNFYHSNKKKKTMTRHAFMNSLLAVTVSMSPVVDNSHTLLPGNLKVIYWPHIHMHKKGWIFKIKLDVISSHVRYVRSEVLLAQTSREGFQAVCQQQHGQFQSALRGEGK